MPQGYKAEPSKKPPAEINPPAARTKTLLYAETSFSSGEDSDEPSVTTFTFENVVDSISFLISEHGTRTIRLHEISAASTSEAFSLPFALNESRILPNEPSWITLQKLKKQN